MRVITRRATMLAGDRSRGEISALINRNLLELDNFKKIFKKFKILKNLNASMDFGQIQYQSSLIDRIYLDV